jgi:hypothetical protein
VLPDAARPCRAFLTALPKHGTQFREEDCRQSNGTEERPASPALPSQSHQSLRSHFGQKTALSTIAMRKVTNTDSDKKVLIAACVVDGINRYMNQILIPGGFINKKKLSQAGTGLNSDLNKKKHEIAESIASRLDSVK